jgi:fatty-acyl-CoA synthase
VTGADAPPEAWTDWLLTHHALPPLAGGAVHSWHDALANDCRCPIWPWARRPVDPALHQRHHRPAQGLHAHARQRHAQRHGQQPLGQRHAENVTLAVVPMFHITGMVSGDAHHHLYWQRH